MSTESVASIIEYLRSLAPHFFAQRMRGASEHEILRLEQAAGTTMSDGHREFLRAMGMTPARVLNPFLNNRDWRIDTLVEEYEVLRNEGISLPPGVVYFSSSEITGENIFLCHGPSLSDDPEIGDLSNETGQFVRSNHKHLESYLRWFTFFFRRGQYDHELDVSPVWNEEAERWEGDARKCRQLIDKEGFQRVYSLDNDSECFERRGVVASLYSDGSMGIAGDDLDELTAITNSLAAQLTLRIERVPKGSRLRAPRE